MASRHLATTSAAYELTPGHRVTCRKWYSLIQGREILESRDSRVARITPVFVV